MTKINKDLYYVMMVLGTSALVSGTIMAVIGPNALAVSLGVIKIVIALPIMVYTYKHKLGQREVVSVQDNPRKNQPRYDGSRYYDASGTSYRIGNYDKPSDKY